MSTDAKVFAGKVIPVTGVSLIIAGGFAI